MPKPKVTPLEPIILPKKLCRACGKGLLNATFAGLGWTCLADGCTGGTRQDPALEAPKKRRSRQVEL